MGKYKCKICGKEFDRIGNGVYCNGPHYRPCKVCGKPVPYGRPSEPYKCCSIECTNILADRSKKKNLGQRKCKECGKLFYPAQASQVYCDGPHTAICSVCGKEFSYTCRPTERRSTCSDECQEKQRSLTVFEATGFHNIAQVPEVRKKISDNHKTEEFNNKIRSTNMLLHNYENLFEDEDFQRRNAELQRNPEFQAHRYDAYEERTGFKTPMHNPAVLEHRREHNQEKYHRDGVPFSDDGHIPHPSHQSDK